MTQAIRSRLFLAFTCFLGSGVGSEAAVYLPVTDASLVDRSPIAIVGRIIRRERSGEAYTAYHVSVERILKGNVNAPEISIAVPGSETYFVSGMPHFVDGDRVILFLVSHPDGKFRIVELMLGAFREVYLKNSSETRAQRDLLGSTSLGEPQPEPARDFLAFAAWIEGRARGERAAATYERPKADLAVDERYRDSAPFTLLGSPARWTQFDSGGAVPWVLRLGGSTMAAGGVTAFQTALNAFNNEPAALMAFTYAGTNAGAQSIYVTDGLNAVLMNDPFDDIPLSYNCSTGGILGRGGFWTTGSDHTYKGLAHRTILEGNIVTQDGADCSLVQSAGAFGAQVLAHELGHAVGLGHACGDTASGPCVVPSPQDDALMRASAHGGGRGATFSSDDVAALIRLYERPTLPGLGTPAVTSPGSGQNLVATGVGFGWTGVGGATGYDIRVINRSTGVPLFSGLLLGGNSTSTLITLGAGSFRFEVRACSGGFAPSQCGQVGTVSFTVSPAAPSGAPTVAFPTQGANLSSSTQTLSWTAVTPNPALSGLTYEVQLRDLTAGTTALQITVPSPNLSTIFTMKSSTQYEIKVRACQASCGPYSTAVTFAVTLPPVPTLAPTGLGCSVSGGNSLTCNWNAVANADAYQVQVVQAPPAGPGGGALTVAARQVSATTVTLPVPVGAATVFIAACNGNGCGPNATTGISAAGPNPSQANIGTPMAGTVVAGPGVLFTWNRVPGDSGSNTPYRLFVQDLSRQSTALDVFTTSNFYSAFFKAEGARYDALVVSNPGLPSQATGPAQGFNVAGASATSPTLVSPPHNSSVTSGNIQLGWSPVPGATLYEYFVAVLGQGSASARGVTPGLLAQVPLNGSGSGTVYSGIVRACPVGAICVSGSDVGWGPWSNAPGGPGVTNFTVLP